MITKIIPKDWQDKSLIKWKNNKFCGMNIVGTGGGKTISAILMMLDSRENTLIIVKSEMLMNQWKNEIKTFCTEDESKIGFYYGKEKSIKPITIALIQTLTKEKEKEWDKMFDFLIVDEARFMGAEKFFEFFEYNKNFKKRIGLTATLKRDDGEHKKILEYMGGYNYIMKEEELLEMNLINKFIYISYGIKLDEKDEFEYKTLKIQLSESYKNLGGMNPFMKLPYNNPMYHIQKKYIKLFQKEKKFMQMYYKKIKHTIELVKLHKDKKILIFNELNTSSEYIYNVLKQNNLNPLIITSKNKKNHNEILENFANDNSYNVLVSTKILDEGYNLPNIEVGIIVNSSKSETQIKQRIGRIIRKSKRKSLIYDLYLIKTRDENNMKERKKIIDYADEYKTILNN